MGTLQRSVVEGVPRKRSVRGKTWRERCAMSGLSLEARKALLAMKGDVRNDTPNPVDHTVGKLLLDGVELTYDELKFFVEGRCLQEARDAVAGMPADDRRKLAARTSAALAKNYKKVLRNNFTKKVADDFYADLLLWTAAAETQNGKGAQ